MEGALEMRRERIWETKQTEICYVHVPATMTNVIIMCSKYVLLLKSFYKGICPPAPLFEIFLNFYMLINSTNPKNNMIV